MEKIKINHAMELYGIASGERYVHFDTKRKWVYYKAHPSKSRHRMNKIVFFDIIEKIKVKDEKEKA